MNISGENLNNSLSARDIVGWYNGIPWNANLKIDLSGETVAIFGQGNVAIDVARILLSPVEKLKVLNSKYLSQNLLKMVANIFK